MEKRAVGAVLILLFMGMLILVGVETVAKSLGGTPLMILCYVIIGAVLGGYLLKMKKEKGEEPEDESGSEGSLSEEIPEELESEERKGEENADL